MTEYSWIYCLKETGTITQGPNKGMVLNEHIQESMGNGSLEDCRILAAKHKNLEPEIKIEIWRKQFRAKPKHHFHYEFVEIYSD